MNIPWLSRRSILHRLGCASCRRTGMHESLNRMRWLALSAMFALAGCVQTGAGLQAADPARLAEAQAQRLAEIGRASCRERVSFLV